MKVLVSHDQNGNIHDLAVPSRQSHPGSVRVGLRTSSSATVIELDIPDIPGERLHEKMQELRVTCSVRDGRIVPKAI